MNIRPLGDRLVIKKVEIEEKTKSGIVLPDSAKEQPSIAEIVAIGDEILNDDKKKDLVKIGDRVIYSKYSGTELKLDKEEVIVLKLSDLLAVVE